MNHISLKKADLEVIQSHPLHRMWSGQYQTFPQFYSVAIAYSYMYSVTVAMQCYNLSYMLTIMTREQNTTTNSVHNPICDSRYQ